MVSLLVEETGMPEENQSEYCRHKSLIDTPDTHIYMTAHSPGLVQMSFSNQSGEVNLALQTPNIHDITEILLKVTNQYLF